VFTNQYGVGKDESGRLAEAFIEKIRLILKELDIPIRVYAALGKDVYRKPRLGMWHEWIHHDLPSIVSPCWELDLEHSFFVGDAAGRSHGWARGRKADFADMDRKFAMNAGLEFMTPDFFFNKHSHDLPDLEFHPPSLLKPDNDKERQGALESLLFAEQTAETTEMVLLVGPPGCGKTTLFKDMFLSRGYVHINQDVLKKREKCLALARSALESRKSVMVDGTNPSTTSRAQYIAIARSLGVPVRCILFDANRELVRHLNTYRSVSA
jgi:bifunctional polynucleotide phosphatase/kinase